MFGQNIQKEIDYQINIQGEGSGEGIVSEFQYQKILAIRIEKKIEFDSMFKRQTLEKKERLKNEKT